ncbi:MAG TPA: polysaccharide deacetylase family protein [Gammaproteobacteria bacterium]|nr:polysaccharide deacetylase family protein [Gammaproteobacteria bacterium]
MPYLGLKRQLGKLWVASPKGRKIILLYHSIGNSTWALSEKIFNNQIDWLCDHCEVLSLTELINVKPSTNIQVALTFDDGYVTLHQHVAPKLLDKKINGTAYINTGWIAENQNNRSQSVAKLGHYPDESFLIWPEVKSLYTAGWEIGSHGVNHYNFSQMAYGLMQKELSLSKTHIEEKLKIDCLHFAYPWGRYSKNVKQFAHIIGYRDAVAGYHAPLSGCPDLFALPRLNIAKEYSFNDFKNIIFGKWDYLGIIHKIRGL